MKHYVKPECKFKCRFLQITDAIWVCPHAAYGEGTDRIGAVEEARRLLERAGGYDQVLAGIQRAEFERKEAARKKREDKQTRLAQSIRYDA